MREHFLRPVQDSEGNVQRNSTVRLLEPGSLTPIQEQIYTGPVEPEARTNPWVAESGIVDFYLDAPKTVRIGVVSPEAIDEVFYEDVAVGTSGVNDADVTNLVNTPGTGFRDALLATFATLDSPALIGIPTIDGVPLGSGGGEGGGTDAVSSVNGKVGQVVLNADDVEAASLVHMHNTSQITNFVAAVDDRVQAIVGAAPVALDTLAELASALNDDPDFAATITQSLSTKADLADVPANVTDLGGMASIDQLPSNVRLVVTKQGDVWPDAPTARLDLPIEWVGSDPGPAGMRSGDTRLIPKDTTL